MGRDYQHWCSLAKISRLVGKTKCFDFFFSLSHSLQNHQPTLGQCCRPIRPVRCCLKKHFAWFFYFFLFISCCKIVIRLWRFLVAVAATVIANRQSPPPSLPRRIISQLLIQLLSVNQIASTVLRAVPVWMVISVVINKSNHRRRNTSNWWPAIHLNVKLISSPTVRLQSPLLKEKWSRWWNHSVIWTTPCKTVAIWNRKRSGNAKDFSIPLGKNNNERLVWLFFMVLIMWTPPTVAIQP